jgi:hypothetical protein
MKLEELRTLLAAPKRRELETTEITCTCCKRAVDAVSAKVTKSSHGAVCVPCHEECYDILLGEYKHTQAADLLRLGKCARCGGPRKVFPDLAGSGFAMADPCEVCAREAPFEG